MKALQLVAWKQPPEMREVPDPEPGPGAVVIKIAGAGACHSLGASFDQLAAPG